MMYGAGNGDFSVYDTNYTVGDSTLTLSNMTVGVDPFISFGQSVANNGNSVASYSLLFTLNISPPITGGTLIGGSVQAGVTDGNFDGVGIVTNSGSLPLYSGLIDGVTQLSLFSNPTSISIIGAGNSTNSSTGAGLPGPTLPGPLNANNTIGIEFNFTLTPGDTATFSGSFIVVPVPEPATLSLLAIGGLVLVYRRRR
jgi:hypothetical protein